MKLQSCFLMLLSASLMVTSCKKGDTGPAGPTGATGATGAKGDKGDTGNPGTNGKDGKDGNANVVYSDWKSLKFTHIDHSKPLPPEELHQFWKQEISSTSIDADVMDKGILLMYFKNSSGAILPIDADNVTAISEVDAQGSYSMLLSYSFLAGKVKLFNLADEDDNSQAFIARCEANTSKVRFVVIPGAVAANGRISSGKAQGYSIQQLKKLPYEQVAQLFNIQ